MALSLSSFYAPWTLFLGEIFIYQKIPSLSSIITYSYETPSGDKDFRLEPISDLTEDTSFQMKRSILLNLKRKSEQDKKSNNDIKCSHYFFKKSGDDEEFENELKKTFLKSSNM